MPHIELPPNLPGIRGLMAFRPETATPINELVDVLATWSPDDPAYFRQRAAILAQHGYGHAVSTVTPPAPRSDR